MALPLVLVPGLLDDPHVWHHQARHLADIAPVVVADIARDDTVETMAARVLEDAPAEFALAGFSLGGYVSFAIWRQAPARVKKLAFLGTTARPDTEARKAERLEQMARVGRPGGFDEHMARDMSVYLPRMTESALVDGIIAMQRRQGPEVFVRQSRACMARPDSRPDLSAIACPTLVLCGREDAVLPPERSAEIANGIAGARLVLVEECGHMLPLERPQATTALLREWLLYA
jgi:pimeloyl-ACP methyl ester carboxylesterase